MNYVIRNSDTKESPEIAELLRRSIIEICGPDYGNDKNILNEWTENKTTANVKAWIERKDSLALSCLVNNTTVGFCLANATGEILLLYVLPEFKRKGAGKALFEKVEQSLATQGIERIVTYSTISAKPFYLKMGFVSFGAAKKVGIYDGEIPLEKHIAIY